MKWMDKWSHTEGDFVLSEITVDIFTIFCKVLWNILILSNSIIIPVMNTSNDKTI